MAVAVLHRAIFALRRNLRKRKSRPSGALILYGVVLVVYKEEDAEEDSLGEEGNLSNNIRSSAALNSWPTAWRQRRGRVFA